MSSAAPLNNSSPASGSIPAIIILPLRIFLGIVFFFAGLDKLTDPTFLDPNNGNYIGKQLQGFVDFNNSPLSFLLTSIAIPNASLFGIAMSLTEMVVGVLVLLGLFTRIVAALGLLMSTTLWLTASWGQQPFYTGWDIPYIFGWLTLLLAGAGPYSLDERLAASRGVTEADGARRNFLLRGGALAGAAVAVLVGGGSALSTFMGRSSTNEANTGPAGSVGKATPTLPPSAAQQQPTSVPPAATLAPTQAPAQQGDDYGDNNGGKSGDDDRPTATTASGDINPASTPAAGPSDTPISAPTQAAGGVAIAKISDVAVGEGVRFVNPTTQADAWLIHEKDGSFLAFDSTCTHAGCSVNYTNGSDRFICPCHGSNYSIGDGSVLKPPARKALAKIQIRVDESGGNIYYVSG